MKVLLASFLLALVLALAGRADAARHLLQGSGGQIGRLSSSANVAQAAIQRAVRGTLSTAAATNTIGNTVGAVPFTSYPTYYLQNDGASGFYLGNDLPAYNDGLATGKK